VNGVEQNTGALGHGLPISVGTAIGGKLDNRKFRVFTLLGDGELPEGSNWEAALTAAHYKLDNLCAIIDNNKLQITGQHLKFVIQILLMPSLKVLAGQFVMLMDMI
jgi:Transketolase, N-terminal subunit